MRARPPLPAALTRSERQIVSYPSALFISLIGDLPHVMVIWTGPIEQFLSFVRVETTSLLPPLVCLRVQLS